MNITKQVIQAISLLIVLLLPPTTSFAEPPVKAKATLMDCTTQEVVGYAELRERKSDQGVKLVRINMNVGGLPEGPHGVHIHETASCTPCGTAGGHFDPGPSGNPIPDANHPYHLGDLVNLNVNRRGNGSLEVETTRVTLSEGPISIFDEDGSAFIIHINEDTFCPGGPVAGCAGGGRLACGIIEVEQF